MKYKLPQSEYAGWKVFYVFGNPFLSEPFVFEDDVLTVKAEDSYLHLAKKVGLAFKAILITHPDIEGILRSGDDLVFNTKKLEEFLRSPKTHYMGYCWKAPDRVLPRGKCTNEFMPDYYRAHIEDFNNPMHGLPPYDELMKMNQLPRIQGASGVLIYFSRRACKYIVEELESINWDITVYDDTYGYQYIVEDIATACVLSRRGIYADKYPMWTDSEEIFKEGNYVVLHTNDSK